MAATQSPQESTRDLLQPIVSRRFGLGAHPLRQRLPARAVAEAILPAARHAARGQEARAQRERTLPAAADDDAGISRLAG